MENLDFGVVFEGSKHTPRCVSDGSNHCFGGSQITKAAPMHDRAYVSTTRQSDMLT